MHNALARHRKRVCHDQLTSRRSRVYGRRFEDGRGDSVEEGAVDNVGVSSNPSNVGG